MGKNSNSIIILNPVDENPYCISDSDFSVENRHGNVIVKNARQMSFVLVFRIVQRYGHYSTPNSRSVTNTDNMPQR